MVTQKGKNVKVVGIHGNFDDAQSRVKALFGDKELEKELAEGGFQFSSANSINIGRLVPQVAYYAYAYANLLRDGELKDGELLNVVVPTGNFGNILAAYYAKNMGVPIGKLICASNDNKVLFDFFRSGSYDRNREFILTTSPSKSKDREAAHTLCGFTVYLMIQLLLIIRFRDKECALAHSYAEA